MHSPASAGDFIHGGGTPLRDGNGIRTNDRMRAVHAVRHIFGLGGGPPACVGECSGGDEEREYHPLGRNFAAVVKGELPRKPEGLIGHTRNSQSIDR